MQIEQIDRDAAARLLALDGLHLEAERAHKGELDNNSYVRAFARHRIAALSARPDDSADVMAALKDPVAVHANMLRGTIAIPDLNALAHASIEVAAMVCENKLLRAENAALRGNPGLLDDWVCDDHGTFGCRKCMSPIQLAALGGE